MTTSTQFAARDVPVCESDDERRAEREACLDAGTPYVAVVERDEGAVAEYDLSVAAADDATDLELTEAAIDDLEALIDEYAPDAEAEQPEGEVGWSLGSREGHFVGLSAERARDLAEEIATVARDANNLRER